MKENLFNSNLRIDNQLWRKYGHKSNKIDHTKLLSNILLDDTFYNLR